MLVGFSNSLPTALGSVLPANGELHTASKYPVDVWDNDSDGVGFFAL